MSMEFKHTHTDIQGNITSNISYVLEDDSGISEVIEAFRYFLLAVSFQPATIDEYIGGE